MIGDVDADVFKHSTFSHYRLVHKDTIRLRGQRFIDRFICGVLRVSKFRRTVRKEFEQFLVE